MGIRCCGCMKMKENRPYCEHCGWDERRQNESHQLPIGTVLENKYVVGRVLGQGGFGITYIGWDTMLDIPVAIKEFFPTGIVMRESSASIQVSTYAGASGSRFQESRDRFLREARALAKFSNVHQIVHVHNFFQANNTAYIIMEYVEGVTLRDYVLKNGVLSQERTLSLLRPILAGLEKLHNAGIIHRDISPDNIMLLPEGGAKLLDFGAVRDVSGAVPGADAAKSTTAILKQGYAPIEQYRGKGDLGPWTDVYALCATVIFCLTGQTPPDAPERMMAHMSGEDDGLHFDKIAPGNPRLQKALEHGMAHVAVNRTRSISQLVAEMGIDEMERLERERKEREAREKAERERIEREARERAERERAEREARELAERQRKEREAREMAERERAEREARERAEAARREREAREKAERERKEREAREKAERERIAREAKIKAEQERKERQAKEKAEAARLAKEKAEKERKVREAAAAEKAAQKAAKEAEAAAARKKKEAEAAAAKQKKEAEAAAAKQKKEAAARERKEAAAGKKKKPVALFVILTLLGIGLIGAYLVPNVIIPNCQYNEAVVLMEAGQFEEAIAAFEAMNGYKDSAQQIEACREGIQERSYQEAIALWEDGYYQRAIDAFTELGDYKDSAAQAEACKEAFLHYRKEGAIAWMKEGNYKSALTELKYIHESGLDCSEEIQECQILILSDPDLKHYGRIKVVTSGEPIGKEKQVARGVRGNITVHNLTRVDLDNGCVRYSIDCTPPNTRAITFFNPPSGSIFMFWDEQDTIPGRQTIIFDVLKEDVLAVKKARDGITVKFMNGSDDTASWIYMPNPY